jgi:hypothetical protein
MPVPSLHRVLEALNRRRKKRHHLLAANAYWPNRKHRLCFECYTTAVVVVVDWRVLHTT